MQKQDEGKTPGAKRENWDARELTKESANEEPDETLRKVLRGNEEQGSPNDRDNAGAIDSGETPHGREESKTQTGAKKNG